MCGTCNAFILEQRRLDPSVGESGLVGGLASVPDALGADAAGERSGVVSDTR